MNNDPSLTIPQGLVDALRGARRVAVLTGAGISAESGLATFRDAAWRRALIEQAQPNAGHRALVTIEQHVPTFTLITQNIDSLHQRAGSHNVVELHGNISRVKCFAENTSVEEWQAGDEVPPGCPRCGGLLRPDVVWFGELLPKQAYEQAVEAATRCDVFFSIGTSGVVEPAASLVRLARRYHAVTATINLDVTPRASQYSYQINGPAGVVLPRLVQMAWS